MKRRFRFYALKLCLLMIIIFLIQIFLNGFTELFVLNNKAFDEIWRFLTAIFLHGSLLHLVYNLFALALFGSILEKLIGSWRFFIIFFISGILANLVSVNFYPSSLGASGAIFGIIGALIVLSPLLIVWAFGLPMPIFIAGILWGFGDLIGALGFLSGNALNNVGNIAHLSGMVFGLIFGMLFRSRNENAGRRESSKVVIDEDSMRDWEERHLR